MMRIRSARAAGLLSLTVAAAIVSLACKGEVRTTAFRGDYGTAVPTATASPIVTVGPRPDVSPTATATPAGYCDLGPRPGCP